MEEGKGDPIPLSVWERLELRLASASFLVPQMLEHTPGSPQPALLQSKDPGSISYWAFYSAVTLRKAFLSPSLSLHIWTFCTVT